MVLYRASQSTTDTHSPTRITIAAAFLCHLHVGACPPNVDQICMCRCSHDRTSTMAHMSAQVSIHMYVHMSMHVSTCISTHKAQVKKKREAAASEAEAIASEAAAPVHASPIKKPSVGRPSIDALLTDQLNLLTSPAAVCRQHDKELRKRRQHDAKGGAPPELSVSDGSGSREQRQRAELRSTAAAQANGSAKPPTPRRPSPMRGLMALVYCCCWCRRRRRCCCRRCHHWRRCCCCSVVTY